MTYARLVRPKFDDNDDSANFCSSISCSTVPNLIFGFSEIADPVQLISYWQALWKKHIFRLVFPAACFEPWTAVYKAQTLRRNYHRCWPSHIFCWTFLQLFNSSKKPMNSTQECWECYSAHLGDVYSADLSLRVPLCSAKTLWLQIFDDLKVKEEEEVFFQLCKWPAAKILDRVLRCEKQFRLEPDL